MSLEAATALTASRSLYIFCQINRARLVWDLLVARIILAMPASIIAFPTISATLTVSYASSALTGMMFSRDTPSITRIRVEFSYQAQHPWNPCLSRSRNTSNLRVYKATRGGKSELFPRVDLDTILLDEANQSPHENLQTVRQRGLARPRTFKPIAFKTYFYPNLTPIK